ncbi:bifunctional preprotein translocase subunit SecD/SecF [Limihaloglobus sulfuriphilus]|uniref:Multifunctional fusion protein n=1 Tax=Limihaloglobus sulfuriphilus TaxID=1851148 RepID=A0A1R7T617_9BACT|nr:protein translocase subunit SecD [Limihaloglobus sulfuriphilus]AQQ72153.1 bifunctional preprotein translocase subunit SecD/SecF [Limihaloglobus sulfuriphilus]
MKTNDAWKRILIIAVVILAVLMVYPPREKLKPGLDLAGGSSLVYQIDTEGMSKSEINGLAANMVPIISRRIDPNGVSNLIIRPQGDTRIEIQLPLASEATRKLRQDYREAVDALESGNINIASVIRALRETPEKRAQMLAELGNTDEKKAVLDELAAAYDAREAAREERDQADARKSEIAGKLAELNVNERVLEYRLTSWVEMEADELSEAIDKFVNPEGEEAELTEEQKAQNAQKKNLILSYMSAHEKWADAVNSLTGENGLNTTFDQAVSKIADLNINVEAFEKKIETASRNEHIAELKERFPARSDEIDNFIEKFDVYKNVRGRLDDPEDLKRMLRGAGVLEFRILPYPGDGTLAEYQAKSYIDQLQKQGPKLASDDKFAWFRIEDYNNWNNQGAVLSQFADEWYVLASNDPDETMLKGAGGGWKLAKAKADTDQYGRRAIGFMFNESGANLFYKLTSNNIDRALCILLDDTAISAPNIQSGIRSQGIITGSFSQTEQSDMVNKLNAGSLPARLSEAPISEKTIGATIGEEYRDQGIKAGLIGLVAVAAFMIVYYMAGGIVASVALVLNILFILAVMAFSRATFTLPGIAGLILTMGMAVDANVLIFERIREELKSGTSLKMSIANGYQKAFRTILDANATTFITALILYLVASEEIKGFAIVLMYGIISSMFTALFVTRVIFNWMMASGMIKDSIKMLTILRNPSVNWMGLRKVFFVISAVLVIGGLTVFFTRDNTRSNKYDIEFTGGTSLQINLVEDAGLDRVDVEKMVRQKGEEIGSSGLMSARVYTVGESGNQFEVNTIETNKTYIDVKFSDASMTADMAAAKINETIKNEQLTILNVDVVSREDGALRIYTSQIPKSEMNTLIADTFEGVEYAAGEPQVEQIVNEAVIDTFGDLLKRQRDLSPEIVKAQIIDDALVEDKPELAQFFSGLLIECKLDKQVSGKELAARFNSLRFKSNVDEMAWYQYDLLNTDATPITDESMLDSFYYISVHPDAGYRELDENELTSYISGEKEKVIAAASMESSLPRVTQFNPSIGAEAKTKALIAIILSLLAIIGYIWIRFGEARFGFAAIAALVHDVCITLGAVTACTYIAETPLGAALGIRDFKIDLQMIAAFLTIIGYSLNDTIVVFDRIREQRGRRGIIRANLISDSINMTISRTLLTSLTTLLVVVIMYIGGGVGLRGFTFAMMVGIIVGTYSSIAIAAPILLLGNTSKTPEKNSK